MPWCTRVGCVRLDSWPGAGGTRRRWTNVLCQRHFWLHGQPAHAERPGGATGADWERGSARGGGWLGDDNAVNGVRAGWSVRSVSMCASCTKQHWGQRGGCATYEGHGGRHRERRGSTGRGTFDRDGGSSNEATIGRRGCTGSMHGAACGGGGVDAVVHGTCLGDARACGGPRRVERPYAALRTPGLRNRGGQAFLE